MAGATVVVKPSANSALAPTTTLASCHDAALTSDAFQRLYRAPFMSTGLIYFAVKHLYVHKSRFDEVDEGMTTALKTMGPLNNAEQLNADSDLEVVKEEQFGLASSIWNEVRDRTVFLAHQIEAGYSSIYAHGPLAQDGNGPSGGFKKSCIGRNFGDKGVTQFQGYYSISGAPVSLIA